MYQTEHLLHEVRAQRILRLRQLRDATRSHTQGPRLMAGASPRPYPSAYAVTAR